LVEEKITGLPWSMRLGDNLRKGIASPLRGMSPSSFVAGGLSCWIVEKSTLLSCCVRDLDDHGMSIQTHIHGRWKAKGRRKNNMFIAVNLMHYVKKQKK
jgi:hypothetical protein